MKTEESSAIQKSPNQRLAEESLDSYWKFLDYIEYKGGTKSFGDIHSQLATFLSKPQYKLTTTSGNTPRKPNSGTERRRLVLVPRGHLKSTLCSVGYVLWRIWRNPNIRIVVCTATKDLSLQFIREIKQYLEDEDLQERIWNNRPHIAGRMIPVLDKVAARRRDRLRWEADDYTEATDKKVVWRADAVQVMRGAIMKEPTVLAASPGANITGMHFDLAIMDDIINDDTVATEAKIEKTLQWAQDLESVIDPQRVVYMGRIGQREYYEVVGDEVAILGTRYARHDYYGYILDNIELLEYSTFIRNVYLNGQDDSAGYLWAEKFNAEVLDRIKRRQGPRRFASQYLNQIMADEDVILRTENIQYFSAEDCEIKEDGYVEWSKKDDNGILRSFRVKPIIMIDPAISEKKGADYSVLTVGGQDADRNLYIFDIKFGRFTPNQIIENLFFLIKKWKLNCAYVETVAFQQVLIHLIKDSFKKYKPIVVKEFRPRGEKKGRIATFLEPIFANQQIYLEKRLSAIGELREELAYFPQLTVKDDIIDTFAMIAEVTVPTARKSRKNNVIPFKPVNTKYGGLR